MNKTIIFIISYSLVFLLGCSRNKTSSGRDVVTDSSSLSVAANMEYSTSDTASEVPPMNGVAWVKAGAQNIFKVFFTPKGDILVSVNSLGTQIWSVPSGQLLRMLPNHLGYGSYPFIISPDGKKLFFADSANLKCWYARSNSVSPTLFRQHAIVRNLAFSMHGNLLSLVGDDSTLIVLELKDSVRVLQSYKLPGRVQQVHFADDDKIIAIQYGHRARFIDLASGKVIRDFSVQGLSISPTGDLIALGSVSKTNDRTYSRVKVETISGRLLQSITFNADELPSQIALTSRGHLLAYRDKDYLKKYEAATGKLLSSVSDGVYHPICWSNNGDFAAIGLFPQGFGVWNLTAGTLIAKCSLKSGSILTILAISEDARYAVTAGLSGELVLWDVFSGTPIRPLTTHNSAVVSIISNAQNQLSASISESGIAQIWNTLTGTNIYSLSLPDVQIEHLVFSHDGAQFVTNASRVIYDPESTLGNYHTDEVKISLWQAKTGNWFKDFDIPFNEADPPSTIAFSQDDKSLIIYNRSRNQVYDIQTGKLTKEGGVNPNRHGMFSPKNDYTLLDNAPNVGQFELWDVAKDSLLFTRNAHNGFVRTYSWCANESLLVTTGQDDHTLKMWAMPSGQMSRSIDLKVAPVHYGSVSPSGRYFAGSSINGDVNVWDLQSGQIIQTFKEYPCYVRAVSWSPTENLILCGFQDGTIIALKSELAN